MRDAVYNVVIVWGRWRVRIVNLSRKVIFVRSLAFMAQRLMACRQA